MTFNGHVQRLCLFLTILVQSVASLPPVFCVFPLLFLSLKCSQFSVSGPIFPGYLFLISNWAAQRHMHEAIFPTCFLSWKCSWHLPQLPCFLAFKSSFLWLLSRLWFLNMSCRQPSLGWNTVGQSSVFPPLMLMNFRNCPSFCSDSLAKYWRFYILLPFFFSLFSPTTLPFPSAPTALCQARLALELCLLSMSGLDSFLAIHSPHHL